MNASTATYLNSNIHADDYEDNRSNRVSRMKAMDEDWTFNMSRKARSKARHQEQKAVRAVKFMASDFLADEDQDDDYGFGRRY